MNRYSLIIVFCTGCCILQFGCTSEQKSPILASKVQYIDTSSNHIVYDSISIPVQPGTLSRYLINTSFEQMGVHYFTGYSSTRHNIDIFDVTNKRFVRSVPLQKEGSYAVGPLQAIFAHNFDSLFVLDNAFICLVDSAATLIRRWPINQRASRNDNFFKEWRLIGKVPAIFQYDPVGQVIYLQAIPEESGQKKYASINGRIGFPFLAKFNLQTSSAEMVSLAFPPEYMNENYGNMLYPSYSFQKRNAKSLGIDYVFPISSTVFHKNLSDGKESAYECVSTLTQNHAEPILKSKMDDPDFLVKHFHSNINFCKIVRNNHTGEYYRFHYDTLPSNTRDLSTIYLSKNLFLTVLDSNYNIIKEHHVKVKNINVAFSYPYGTGVIIPFAKATDNDDDRLKFLTLNIH